MEAMFVIGLLIILMTISYAPEILENITLTALDYAAAISVATIFVLAWILPSTEYASMVATYTWMMITTITWYIAYMRTNA